MTIPMLQRGQARSSTARHICSACLALTAGALLAHADPPRDPLPAPHYSFDIGSPSVTSGLVRAQDVLQLALPYPTAAVSAETLGLLSPSDDIDALSAANPAVPDGFALLFSVDRQSAGGSAPALLLVALQVPYNVVDQSSRGHAAGDQFASTDLFAAPGATPPATSALHNNVLVRNNFDEGGTDFSAYPETHADTILPDGVPQDRVDATARLSAADPNGPLQPVYFSLTSQSPTLGGFSVPFSGADIFVYAIDPLGACCFDATICLQLTQVECLASGGVFLGAGTYCDPNAVCPQEPNAPAGLGACWFNDAGANRCLELTEADCLSAGGVFQGPGTECPEPNAPAAAGACCLRDGSCIELTESECALAGGVFAGAGTTCPLNTPCDAGGAQAFTTVYAFHDELGLQQDDDVDALIAFDLNDNRRFDGADFVLFSLAPGSPSLTAIPGASPPGSAADVFIARADQATAAFAPAGVLGLAAGDNVDALDFLASSGDAMLVIEHAIQSSIEDQDARSASPPGSRPRIRPPHHEVLFDGWPHPQPEGPLEPQNDATTPSSTERAEIPDWP